MFLLFRPRFIVSLSVLYRFTINDNPVLKSFSAIRVGLEGVVCKKERFDLLCIP